MCARSANERGISNTFEPATKIAAEISAEESGLNLGLRLLAPRANSIMLRIYVHAERQ